MIGVECKIFSPVRCSKNAVRFWGYIWLCKHDAAGCSAWVNRK